MKPESLQALNLQTTRVQTVSMIFKWFSAFVIGFSVVVSILAFLLPVVSVGARYTNPTAPPDQQRADFVGARDQEAPAARNLLVWELAGTAPSLRRFSYVPGPSDLRQDRQWVARLATSLFVLYYGVGGILGFSLFRSYERGNVFHKGTIRGLRWIGVWIIGVWFAGLLFQITGQFWRDHPTFSFQFPSGDLVAGFFLLLIAWIMEEARGLAEEQALTV
jgi:hypothetical protein